MTRLSDQFGASLNPNELLPALVAAVDSGATVDSDIYNWGASNTRRLASSLAKAKAGTGYSDHLVIGDGQSYNPYSSLADLWPNVLRRKLAADGLVDGGTGWVRPQNGYLTDLDSRVTKTGTWDLVSSVYWRATASGSTMTFTSDVAGTAISVAYYNTSAGFTVTVDGGSPVTVTPSGASTVGTYSVTGLSDTTHTVVVTTSTSSPTFIVGFQVYRPNSVRFHNLAGFSWKTSQLTPATSFTSGWTIQQMIPDPDVVHIALGFHDVYESVSIPTITTNITAIRNLWPDADVILHAGPQGTGMSTWPTFVTALYALASSLNVPLVDFYRRSGGSYAAADALGLMLPPGNNYYPSAAGHAAWALLAGSRMKIEEATLDAPTVKTGSALGTPKSGDLGNCTNAPVASTTHAATSKTTPVDADEVPLVDSAASNVLKKLTWANLKAAMLTYIASAAATFTGKTYISASESTATAAGTTTLTVSDAPVQIFTGSTTQTVKLPTTSIVAGQTFTIINNSSGTVSVQASDASAICSVGAGLVGVFTARQDTPTTSTHWEPRVPNSGSSGSSIVVRDSTNRIQVKAVLLVTTTTATAGGTTSMNNYDANTQIWTGSTTQTVKLPSTGVVTGQTFTIINQSSGTVTVQSSDATTLTTLTGGTKDARTYLALQDTPTGSAHWRII